MPNLRRIEAAVPAIREKKKVAAYARVSMQSERMLHSLSAQVSYYSGLIQKNPDWEYAGVYADDFISGTNTVKRDEFKRMLADCEAGKIDIILTKSISRFARNTVDLLETVRHLKDLGVEVRFEKERIRSMDGDGELMLTILASFAQEESRSISDNVKWGIRKRMQNGIPNGHFRIYGYRWEGDELVIVPEEAEVVKRIFRNFLDGKSRLETERELADEGITTRDGCRWGDSNIKVVLTNVTYTGRSNAANADVGTAQRYGTPQINTAGSSTSAITSTKAESPAVRPMSRKIRSRTHLSEQSTSCSPRRKNYLPMCRWSSPCCATVQNWKSDRQN